MRRLLAFLVLFFAACNQDSTAQPAAPLPLEVQKVIFAAKSQVGATLHYDPSYIGLLYPGGDVPIDRGVCTDVIVRAFRSIGIDLQKEVHLDMKAAFTKYPKLWGLRAPDPNIDHRRVPNLITFLTRRGKKLDSDYSAKSFKPGDLVTWMLPRNLPHIGIVSDELNSSGSHFKVIHNVGAGAQIEDVLFEYEITGHFRYFGE